MLLLERPLQLNSLLTVFEVATTSLARFAEQKGHGEAASILGARVQPKPRQGEIGSGLTQVRSSRWVLFARILWGSGGLSSTKQGVGQTFVRPQRQFWVPASSPKPRRGEIVRAYPKCHTVLSRNLTP